MHRACCPSAWLRLHSIYSRRPGIIPTTDGWWSTSRRFFCLFLFTCSNWSLSVKLSGFFCSPCFAVRDVLDILRWSRSPRVGSQVDGKLAIPNLTFCTWYITDRTLPPPIVAPFPSLPFRNHTGIMHPQLCHATLPLSSSPLSYCELGICNL